MSAQNYRTIDGKITEAAWVPGEQVPCGLDLRIKTAEGLMGYRITDAEELTVLYGFSQEATDYIGVGVQLSLNAGKIIELELTTLHGATALMEGIGSCFQRICESFDHMRDTLESELERIDTQNAMAAADRALGYQSSRDQY